jgi:signal transduction histidine kinase
MSDGLLVLDSGRRVRYCNARAGELLGIDATAVIGESAEALICRVAPALAAPDEARLAWGRLVGEPPGQAGAEIATIGPPPRDLLVGAFRVADTPGSSLGLVLRDVTDAKELARLKERERIAMDLHDGVIQSLYAVILGLGTRARAVEGSTGEPARALRQAMTRIKGIIAEIRNYIFDLRLHELGEHGLRAGLEALAEELRINTVIRPALEVDPGVEAVLGPDAVRNVLYIAREATSNVIRHARASEVMIRLARTYGRLALTVRDTGGGFDAGERRHGQAARWRGAGPAQDGRARSRWVAGWRS